MQKKSSEKFEQEILRELQMWLTAHREDSELSDRDILLWLEKWGFDLRDPAVQTLAMKQFLVFRRQKRLKIKRERRFASLDFWRMMLEAFYDDMIRSNFLFGRNRNPNLRFFRFLELLAHILPTKVRLSTFEPAYNDEKAAYLQARRRYRSKIARKWLKFWFAVHVLLMVAQCLWGMLGEKLKRIILNSLPEAFRKFGGN